MGININKVIQGDVILYRLDKLPEGIQTRELDTKILQQSEVTGHHHYFLPGAPVTILETGISTAGDTITPDTGKFLIVGDKAVLYHGVPNKDKDYKPLDNKFDHYSIELPAGIYSVVITQQYDYDRNEITEVRD